MNNYKNLNAWKSAKELAILVYSITKNFPKKEDFALVSQINRAVVSIVANIAEGSSRNSAKDFLHFLEISAGSLFELETLIEIAFEVGYVSLQKKDSVSEKMNETIKLIYGLKKSLRSTVNR